MWKEDEYARKNGNVRYAYFRDADTCNFCKEHGDKGIYSFMNCSPKRSADCNDNKLITITRDVDNGNPVLAFYLYCPVPGDNEFKELEEITIIFPEKGYFSSMNKDFCDCPYDKSLFLKLTKDEVRGILESIPLIREGNMPPVFDNLRLNIFNGGKNKWLDAYYKRFDELRIMLKYEATRVPPIVKSPLENLHKFMFSKSC